MQQETITEVKSMKTSLASSNPKILSEETKAAVEDPNVGQQTLDAVLNLQECVDDFSSSLDNFAQYVNNTLIDPPALLDSDSATMTSDEGLQLIGLLESAGYTEYTLVYRGTRDGFGKSDWHNLVDDTGATVTVIKTVTGKVFGFFTDISWSPSSFSGRNNGNSWLFMFDDSLDQIVKLDFAGTPGTTVET